MDNYSLSDLAAVTGNDKEKGFDGSWLIITYRIRRERKSNRG
jgi:hypothetical protein